MKFVTCLGSPLARGCSHTFVAPLRVRRYYTSAKVRVQQDVLLALTQPTRANVRIQQDEIIAVISNNLLVERHVRHYIVNRRKKPKLKKHGGQFQSPVLLTSEPYAPRIEKGVTIHRTAVPVHHARRWGRIMNEALVFAAPYVAPPPNTQQPVCFVTC